MSVTVQFCSDLPEYNIVFSVYYQFILKLEYFVENNLYISLLLLLSWSLVIG